MEGIIAPAALVRVLALASPMTRRWARPRPPPGVCSAETATRVLRCEARQLGVTGKTAWLLRRKITHAMRRGEHELLLFGVVELDESLIGGREPGSGKRGRASQRKTLVAVSAEQTPGGGLSRAHLRVIGDASAKTLTKAAGALIQPGSTVKTDGWSSYRALPGAGYLH